MAEELGWKIGSRFMYIEDDTPYTNAGATKYKGIYRVIRIIGKELYFIGEDGSKTWAITCTSSRCKKLDDECGECKNDCRRKEGKCIFYQEE
jgi:hypothetical protein